MTRSRLLFVSILHVAVGVVACGSRVTLGTVGSEDDPRSRPDDDASTRPDSGGCGPNGCIIAPGDDAGSGEAGADGGLDAYDPCAGRTCGAPCTLCAPADPNCVEPAVVRACDAQGMCNATPPVCPPTGDGGQTHDSCRTKRCGDSCTLCPPGSIDCFEPAVPKRCDSAGACRIESVTCP